MSICKAKWTGGLNPLVGLANETWDGTWSCVATLFNGERGIHVRGARGVEPFPVIRVQSNASAGVRIPQVLRDSRFGASMDLGCAPRLTNGERGIRTPETVARLRDFQSRSFSRSDISPKTAFDESGDKFRP